MFVITVFVFGFQLQSLSLCFFFFFFSSRRRHTRLVSDWSSDVCSSDLNPLTGTYAALGGNELIGAQLAVEQMNAKGGILGRKVELLSEDSTSGDAGTAEIGRASCRERV